MHLLILASLEVLGERVTCHRAQRGLQCGLPWPLCCCVTHGCDHSPDAAGAGDQGRSEGRQCGHLSGCLSGPSEHTGRQRKHSSYLPPPR